MYKIWVLPTLFGKQMRSLVKVFAKNNLFLRQTEEMC